MANDTFIEDYLNWLRTNITTEKLENGLIEITTPFLDRNNDYTQIYIEKKGNNRLLLSDYGYMINELIMLGIDVNLPKRKEIIRTILNRFGAKLFDDAITIECMVVEYPKAKHNLLQAMLAIDDLFYVSRPNVISMFRDEVENFFKTNEVYYMSNISFIGIAGYTHNYEFALQRNKNNPERLVKVINKLSKTQTESILFAWNDTKAVRDEDSVLFTFINDENSVNEKHINALENYGVVPMIWSNRKNYLDKLA